MGSVTLRLCALVFAMGVAIVVGSAGAVVTGEPVAHAATCVKFVNSNWDAPGNDNYMPQLNDEWVRIKNVCSTNKSIGAWRIHDYGKKHVYRFPPTYTIKAGATITLRSGTGTNTSTTRYWQRSYGAVWNNTGKEKAYVRNASGSLIHTWIQSGWPKF